jgi:hypothetical protein
MQPASYDITHRQGATFDKTYTLTNGGTPWNLTTYTGRMQLRLSPDHPTVAVEFSTTDGTMVLGNGTLQLIQPASVWSALAARTYVHDLELTDSNSKVYPIWAGTWTLDAEVTRG